MRPNAPTLCWLVLAPLVTALALARPAAAQEGGQLEELLSTLSPEERFARRVTPEVLVVEQTTPAVVYIQTDLVVQQRTIFGISQRRATGAGSGVIIRKEGFVVTNYHVVRGARRITVSFEESIDPREYEAEVVSYVQNEDLALLKIKGNEGQIFPTIPLGISADLMIGERVVAIGNPLGQRHTASVGIISGLHRDVSVQAGGSALALHFDDLIQTDASINQGNSGGPLLNINGELIGINTAVNVQAENIGFAIPVDRVRLVLEEQLIAPESYRAWLGFDLSEEEDSLRVAAVLDGGPAARAGLRPGDRIVGLAGQELHGLEDYRLARVAIRPSEAVPLRVRRGRAEQDLTLEPLDRSDGVIFERLGVAVREQNYRWRGQFLLVEEVLPDGAAAEIGLAPGDLIDAVKPTAGRLARPWRVESRYQLAELLSRLEPDSELEIDVYREGELYKGVVVLD